MRGRHQRKSRHKVGDVDALADRCLCAPASSEARASFTCRHATAGLARGEVKTQGLNNGTRYFIWGSDSACM